MNKKNWIFQESDLKDAFKIFDRDKDGFIDMKELKKVILFIQYVFIYWPSLWFDLYYDKYMLSAIVLCAKKCHLKDCLFISNIFCINQRMVSVMKWYLKDY